LVDEYSAFDLQYLPSKPFQRSAHGRPAGFPVIGLRVSQPDSMTPSVRHAVKAITPPFQTRLTSGNGREIRVKTRFRRANQNRICPIRLATGHAVRTTALKIWEYCKFGPKPEIRKMAGKSGQNRSKTRFVSQPALWPYSSPIAIRVLSVNGKTGKPVKPPKTGGG